MDRKGGGVLLLFSCCDGIRVVGKYVKVLGLEIGGWVWGLGS